MIKLKGLYVLSAEAYDMIYGPQERIDIAKYVDIYSDLVTTERFSKNPEILHDAEVLFSGWGAPRFTKGFLDHAPNLKAIFYGAGSVRELCDDGELFKRDIIITNSVFANAIPVAEFCVSQILFCLKQGWHFALYIKKNKVWPPRDFFPANGAFKSTVALISLGFISCRLIKLLKPYDVNIMVASGHLTAEKARELGVTKCTVDEAFHKGDVISIHSPGHKTGQITGKHISSMKPYASLINTARGQVIKQEEMLDVLEERTDLIAILDVTDPEPPTANSRILNLENVITLPHISGSIGAECRRMGQYAVNEMLRFIKGQPQKHQLFCRQLEYMA